MKQFPSLFAISLFSTLMLSSPASAQERAFEPSRREVVLETTSGNIRIALFKTMAQTPEISRRFHRKKYGANAFVFAPYLFFTISASF